MNLEGSQRGSLLATPTSDLRTDLADRQVILPQLENFMIVRIWHGRTKRSRAAEYSKFLEERAIPDYGSVPGIVEVKVLRRDAEDVTHFLTVTHWESEDAIRSFAGSDILKAKYYPEDSDFLLEFEPQVQHFEVVAARQGGSSP